MPHHLSYPIDDSKRPTPKHWKDRRRSKTLRGDAVLPLSTSRRCYRLANKRRHLVHDVLPMKSDEKRAITRQPETPGAQRRLFPPTGAISRLMCPASRLIPTTFAPSSDRSRHEVKEVLRAALSSNRRSHRRRTAAGYLPPGCLSAHRRDLRIRKNSPSARSPGVALSAPRPYFMFRRTITFDDRPILFAR